MTAQVGIINTKGIALATDSIGTVPIDKIKKHITAEKLFALPKNHSVGIMVNNYAEFTGTPWETIIKTYTSHIGNNTFDTLQEYSDNLLNFLSQDIKINTPNYEKKFVRDVLDHCLMDNAIGVRHKRSISNEIENKIKYYFEQKFIDGLDDNFIKSFVKKHKPQLLEYMNEIVNISIDKKIQDNLILLCAYIISKSDYMFTKPSSGLIIAGFGKEELFPTIAEYTIIGAISEKLIYRLENQIKILECINNPYSHPSAAIMPFAQKDVVETYTSGIHPQLKTELFTKVNKVFGNFFETIRTESPNSFANNLSLKDIDEINNIGKNLGMKILNNFQNKQMENYIRPFTDMLNILGKEEIAALAESLVNLTSTKKRYTTSDEDVGGAIDVAIITKDDGFKWIKKKQFFKPELNISQV